MNINSIGGTSYSGISEVRRTDNLSAGENADIPEIAPKKNMDEYIPSEDDKPIGLYKPSEDENGDPCINYDNPEKKDKSEKCTANTDKVDREIKKLKEKAKQLRQQLKSASEDKRDELVKQLRAVETELSQKDNDSYRRENTIFS